MSYRPPTFNLTCNIWNTGSNVGPPTLAGVVCQLRSPLYVTMQQGRPSGVSFIVTSLILFPALTDVRGGDVAGFGNFSVIECPAGSGRFYTAEHVDDQAKGFPNESRFAYVTQHTPWPIPTP